MERSIPLEEVNTSYRVGHGDAPDSPAEEGMLDTNSSSMPEFSLAPVDGGKDAWAVSSWLLFHRSFGVG